MRAKLISRGTKMVVLVAITIGGAYLAATSDSRAVLVIGILIAVGSALVAIRDEIVGEIERREIQRRLDKTEAGVNLFNWMHFR